MALQHTDRGDDRRSPSRGAAHFRLQREFVPEQML